MPNLLHIDSSPIGEHSISRHLSAAFVEPWKQTNPAVTVTTRDLYSLLLPIVDAAWVAAA